MAIKVLGLMEVCQVLVVSEALNGKWGTMKVMSLGLQGMDDCEELPVIDIIVLFCRNK